MSLSKKSLSVIVLQLAVSLFLIVSGILTVQLDSGFWGQLQAGISGNEIANAVHSFLDGDVATIVVMALGICELIAGVFLLINFIINTGHLTNLFIFVIIIVWLVVIALVDIMGAGGLVNGAFESTAKFLSFLQSFSSHLLVLGALLIVWKK